LNKEHIIVHQIDRKEAVTSSILFHFPFENAKKSILINGIFERLNLKSSKNKKSSQFSKRFFDVRSLLKSFAFMTVMDKTTR
jgi:hypothetical protein